MPKQEVNEIRLLQASLQGNSQSFGHLVLEYQSLICAITYGATGNAVQSEELAQEVFLKAWKNLSQLQDVKKFRPWLCRITKTTVQNWLRSRKRDATSQARPLEALHGTPSTELGPEATTIKREQEELVCQALNHLASPERLALVLFYREHQSIAEVARQLAISENAARQRIYRGRQSLRDKMLTIVEQTLTETKPSTTFATGVVASIAALSTQSTTASAAIMTKVGTTSILGATGKLGLVAATIVVLTGGWFLLNRPSPPSLPTIFHPNNQSTATDTPNDTFITPELASGPPINRGSSGPETHNTPHQTTTTTLALTSVKESRPIRPSTPAPHPAILSGRLTETETGNPIANAEIQLHKDRRILRTHSDPNGFYAYTKIEGAGTYEICIDPPPAYRGYPWNANNPRLTLDPAQSRVQEFQLERACRVAITVVDVNGVAIPRTKVVATSLAEPSPRIIGYFGDERETDPNGYLLYGGFPPAAVEYLITAFHEKLYREERNGRSLGHYRRDYAPAHANVRLTDPNTITEVTMVLYKGESIHGYMEFADGVPAPHMRLSAQPDWWHSNRGMTRYPANEDATFTIEHVTPGMYDIQVTYPREESGDGSIRTVFRTELPLADGEPLIVKLPQNSTQSPASISGTIAFQGEKKPDSVSIYAVNLKTHKQSHTYLSKDHNELLPTFFTINNLQPGDYLLRFYSGEQFEDKIIHKLTVPCAPLTIEIKQIHTAPPQINGQVLSLATGQPIPSFMLRISWQRGRISNFSSQYRWSPVNHNEGEFIWDVEKHGTYKVQVLAEGYAATWSEDVNSLSTEPTKIFLTPGGTLTGRVVDVSGKPLANAQVIPLSLAGSVSRLSLGNFVSEYGAVKTDQQGRFILNNVALGLETLKVTYPDHAFTIVSNIEILEGLTTQGIRIVVGPGGIIEGTIYNDEGVPEVGQAMNLRARTAYIDYFAEPIANVITDSNGFYRFEKAPCIPCVVERARPKEWLGVIIQNLVPQQGQVTRLDFGGTPVVQGSILLNDQTLPNHKLSIGTFSTRLQGEFSYFTETDARGDFILRGVIPGHHTLYCAHPVQEKQWIELTTFTMGTEDLELGVLSKSTESPRP